MIKKIFSTLLLSICCLNPWTAYAGITNYPGLVTPSYWIKQNNDGDKVILDAAGVKKFNASVRQKSKEVADLANYPPTLAGSTVKKMLSDNTLFDETLYLNGSAVSSSYKNILKKQINLAAVPEKVTTKWGITVKRTNVRNIPTGEGLFFYPHDKEFDALQETALDPGEAVAVLHQSANGFFYFVQAGNYFGWVSKFDIALTDRQTWMQYLKPKNFLVVTARDFARKVGGSNVLYQQGSVLPVTGTSNSYYKVVVPVRGGNGSLQGQEIYVDKNEQAVHYGYLPYTANNIIRSVFRFHNASYGWGGSKNSVDCSSLIFNAYRTVGIYLPRNADQQENSAGIKHKLTGLNDSQRREIIGRLRPGAALYMEGHAVVYLGQLRGEPYVIHALGSYYANDGAQKVMRVVVSDLTLLRGTGKSFLQSVTTANEFK